MNITLTEKEVESLLRSASIDNLTLANSAAAKVARKLTYDEMEKQIRSISSFKGEDFQYLQDMIRKECETVILALVRTTCFSVVSEMLKGEGDDILLKAIMTALKIAKPSIKMELGNAADRIISDRLVRRFASLVENGELA